VLKFPLLRLDDSTAWTRWFEAANVANPVLRGPTLNRASMLIDVAVDGQGIALARTALAAWDMLNGRLVKPIDVSLRMPNTYWIVCPKTAANAPRLRRFGNGCWPQRPKTPVALEISMCDEWCLQERHLSSMMSIRAPGSPTCSPDCPIIR
jgi:LysR substrate binding domain